MSLEMTEASIQKPGVLVSLNSLLEQNGSIRLLPQAHRTPSGSRGCHDHERRLRRAGSHQSKRVGPYGLDRGFAGPASKEADPAPESRYRVPGRSRLGQKWSKSPRK